MIGVHRRNSSRITFIAANGQIVTKGPGNINQLVCEPGDFIQGPIGENYYTDVAKFEGGDKNDIESYDSQAHVQRDKI